MYSYRFTREYLFHYFYVSIHTGTWTSQSHCHHICCLLVIFFSAVVGGESYIFKKRSPSFLWFAHTCKAWYYRIKTGGGGGKNVCPFYWTYFENAPCTFAPSYCDYGNKYSKSANAHILFIKVKMWFSVAKDQWSRRHL